MKKKLSFRTPINESNNPDGYIVYYLESDNPNIEQIIQLVLKQKTIPGRLKEQFITRYGTMPVLNMSTRQIENFIAENT